MGSEEHPSAPCPKCGHGITIAEFDVDRGEIFACPACGLELEVLGFEPLRLVVAEPAEEDL
ncbi:MAG: zf-TFIIB domain-containing protein [Vicinamibacteria bacterium]